MASARRSGRKHDGKLFRASDCPICIKVSITANNFIINRSCKTFQTRLIYLSLRLKLFSKKKRKRKHINLFLFQNVFSTRRKRLLQIRLRVNKNIFFNSIILHRWMIFATQRQIKKNFARYLIIVYHLVSQRAIDKANFYVTLLELSIIRYNHDPANIQHQGLPTRNFPLHPANSYFK